MPKSLVKVVDAAIFPAALMIAGKFIGLYIVVKIFDLEWGVDNISNQLISSRPVFYSQDIEIASSYSDLSLLVIMLLGFSAHLVRAVFFHDSHIDPRLAARLAAKGLFKLIQNSYEIYHKATVWLLFLWLSNITIIINTIQEKTYLWVMIFALVTTIILSIVFLRDVSYEISLSKKNISKMDSNI